MRRIVCVSLPHWPTDRLSRRDPAASRPGPAFAVPASAARSDLPFATIASGSGGVRLVALAPSALACGLRAGQTLADARALVPELVTIDADPAGEADDLAALARWMTRWTPWAAPAAPKGMTASVPEGHAIFCDITGCAHLFGGEEALLSDMLRRLRGLGFAARAAIAPTPGAAWALAHADRRAARGLAVSRAEVAEAVRALPVEALRIAPGAADGLRALGLKTVGAVAALPSAALARRFGADLVRALDRALGREEEAISPLDPVVPRRVRLRLVEPLVTAQGVEIAIARAAGEICALLDAHGEGAHGLRISLWRVDGAVFTLDAGAGRPHRDAALWARILKERMAARGEALDLGFGVDLIEAAAPDVERLESSTTDLDPAAAAAARSADALHRLADRLAARIGAERITRIASAANWVPERASRLVPLGEAMPAPVPAGPLAPRPALLMARPEPVEAVAEVPDGPPRLFRWRRLSFRVARAEGPERIACGGSRGARDYYRVETAEGRRFWLYRQGLPGEVTHPRWYVQGMAA